MAIKNINTGRYIKVIREQTLFRMDGVLVGYYAFKDKDTRDLFYSRRDMIKKVASYCDSKVVDLVNEEAVYTDSIKDSRDLNLDFVHDLHLKQRGYSLNATLLRLNIDNDLSSVIRDLFNVDELFKNGLDESLLNVPDYEYGQVVTGIFINQNFSYECLYKELKKIFKDDYIDC